MARNSQAWIAGIFLVTLGCGTSEEYVSTTSSSVGDLDYNRAEDGGVRNTQLGSATSVRPFPGCDGSTACRAFVAYGSVVIAFDPPPGMGSHDLEELQATVCQDGGTSRAVCAPIFGHIEVTEMVAPCGEEACGRFEADLVLKPSKLTKAPAVWGETHLSYAETVRTQSRGGGGCDNFQGG